jgi:hypothetical protein
MRARTRHPRPRLAVHPLEPRDVPAGTIQASLAGGVLTLTGDDLANQVTIQVTAGAGANVILFPDAGAGGTTIDDLNDPAPPVAGAPVTILGTAAALKADLKGGDDSLFIDGTADFVLPGGARVQLGDGANTLGFSTAGTIDLGSLVVKAGDGKDTAVVAAGAGLGSRVAGAASFDFGAGDSDTTLQELAFPGAAGLRLADAQTGATSTLAATDVNVTRGVKAAIGGSRTTLRFTGSRLGGLSASAHIVTTDLDSTTVLGDVSVRAEYGAFLRAISGAVQVGNVSLAGGELSSLDNSATSFSAGNVSVQAGNGVLVNNQGAAFSAGNISARAGFQAAITSNAGTVTAGTVSVRSAALGSFVVGGTSATITGALKVVSAVQAQVNFGTTAVSEVTGDLTVNGGWYGNLFTTNAQFRAGRNVTLTLGDGTNAVALGDGSAPVTISGNLTVQAGGGDDTVTLKNVAVSGATTVATGAGKDALTIDLGSRFGGAFRADLGTGDDTISVAQDATATAAVTFVGRAAVRAGAGNDTLLLGRDPGAGGTASTAAVFTAALANTIDGGTGINTFDGLTPTQAPAQYTALSAASFLHWTDPNP